MRVLYGIQEQLYSAYNAGSLQRGGWKPSTATCTRAKLGILRLVTFPQEISPTTADSWRPVKDRTKTMSVGLVLCLNLSVDPPDIQKVVREVKSFRRRVLANIYLSLRNEIKSFLSPNRAQDSCAGWIRAMAIRPRPPRRSPKACFINTSACRAECGECLVRWRAH